MTEVNHGAGNDAALTTSQRPGSRRSRGIPVAFLVSALIAGHTMSSMAAMVLPAVAPAVARDYGIDASLIGYQISLVSVGMLTSLMLFGNLPRRFGACRTNQAGHGMVGAGMLILLIPWAPFLIIGSLVVGLGYGVLTPSASHLLMRFTPVERRNLVFSLHQVGIPLGGILAALVSPAITVIAGWRWSVVLSAVLLCAVIALMQRGRRHWDDDREPATPMITPRPLAGFTMIWRNRSLRLISITGSCFSWAQFCTASFAVVACVETLGMSLIVAGTVLTVVQAGSALGRVLTGWLVDRLHNTARVLAWIAGMMALGYVAALSMSPALPLLAAYVLFAVLGSASGSWPGPVLAEVGRLAPHGKVSIAIGGSLVITNIGKFLGPIVVVNVYALTRSYSVALASIAIPSAVALYCLIAAQRRKA